MVEKPFYTYELAEKNTAEWWIGMGVVRKDANDRIYFNELLFNETTKRTSQRDFRYSKLSGTCSAALGFSSSI